MNPVGHAIRFKLIPPEARDYEPYREPLMVPNPATVVPPPGTGEVRYRVEVVADLSAPAKQPIEVEIPSTRERIFGWWEVPQLRVAAAVLLVIVGAVVSCHREGHSQTQGEAAGQMNHSAQKATGVPAGKGARCMKHSILMLLGVLMLSVISCVAPLPPATPTGSGSGSGLSLVFKYGVGAKNVLDTAKGTFTKDMIVDPAKKVALRLTAEELDRISAKMDEIDFWSYPDVLRFETPADGVVTMVTPYTSYYFRAERGGTVKSCAGTTRIAIKRSRQPGSGA